MSPYRDSESGAPQRLPQESHPASQGGGHELLAVSQSLWACLQLLCASIHRICPVVSGKPKTGEFGVWERSSVFPHRLIVMVLCFMPFQNTRVFTGTLSSWVVGNLRNSGFIKSSRVSLISSVRPGLPNNDIYGCFELDNCSWWGLSYVL